jgi:hypothetical protein
MERKMLITRAEMAKLIDGRQYRSEMTREEERAAKENFLLVVFGASDDLTEFRGYVDDEAGAYEGATHRFDGKLRLIQNNRDEREIAELIEEGWTPPKVFLEIKALQTDECFWVMSTSVPYSSFTIMEDDSKYCRGIVIDLQEIGLVGGSRFV